MSAAIALASPRRIKASHRRRRKVASSRQHYNYFRDYEAATGRYSQSDPIGLRGGISTYGYVGGNPLKWRDKFGLSPGATTLPPMTAPPLVLPEIPAWVSGLAGAIGRRSPIGALWPSPLGVSECEAPGVDFNACMARVYSEEAKPDREQRPDGCPAGTKPIDRDPRLDRDKIHRIKRGIGAGPKDWVGISPDGTIWTNGGGTPEDNGGYEDYLP